MGVKRCIMSLHVLIFLFFPLLTIGLPAQDESTEETPPTCEDIFALSGLNYTSFYHGAAHGIHSLSLEEIRYFFKSDAPENNKIPTVNIDFRSEEVIHFNAQLWGYENRFSTWALKIMDWFMLNDHPYQYETGTNPLEKLSHQYHMHEIYSRASIMYNELVKNPPKNKQLCACANDVTANGILEEVVNIAKQLKYRGSRSRQGRRKKDKCKNTETYETYESYGGCGGGGLIAGPAGNIAAIQSQPALSLAGGTVQGSRPTNSRGKRATDGDSEDNIELLKKEYLKESNHENAEKLLAVAPWIPGNFTGSDQWISYSAMLTYSLPNDVELEDFATFMFCKLNEPNNDHPVDLF